MLFALETFLPGEIFNGGSKLVDRVAALRNSGCECDETVSDISVSLSDGGNGSLLLVSLSLDLLSSRREKKLENRPFFLLGATTLVSSRDTLIIDP